ncbi:hypothetical protein D3Z36_08910 [Lachnospiraceae bacterium]|nr:hypothetical protein [Lachnospiraceae bacterium]
MEISIHDGINKTLVRILEKMKEHVSLYATLFSNHGDISFPIKIFRICYGEFESYIQKNILNCLKHKGNGFILMPHRVAAEF